MKANLQLIFSISLVIILSSCSDIYYGSPTVNQGMNRHVPRQYFDTTQSVHYFGQFNAGRFHTFHVDDDNLAGHLNVAVSRQYRNAVLAGSAGFTLGEYKVSNDIVPNFAHGTYQYWSWSGIGKIGYQISKEEDFEFAFTGLGSFSYQGGEYFSWMNNVLDTITSVSIGTFNNQTSELSLGSGLDIAVKAGENIAIGISPDVGINFQTGGFNANMHLYLQYKQHTLNLNYSNLSFHIFYSDPDYNVMNYSLSGSYIYSF